MYDRQSESLWSQIMQQAIAGPMTGAKLNMIPVEHTTWRDWRSRHPNSLVLSVETGFKRDYGLNHYEEYWERGQPPPFRKSLGNKPDFGLRQMERVVGLQLGNVQKAYPFSVLKGIRADLHDEVGGRKVTIRFNSKAEVAYVEDAKGEVVPSITTFWFAWQDFYPNTEIYKSK
jgi:hypothetical protein